MNREIGFKYLAQIEKSKTLRDKCFEMGSRIETLIDKLEEPESPQHVKTIKDELRDIAVALRVYSVEYR